MLSARASLRLAVAAVIGRHTRHGSGGWYLMPSSASR
jgi:hypothetical protein